jgi:hypothetical protein
MVEMHIQPVAGREMALITLGSRLDVPRILTGCGNPIMTVRAVARGIGVIETHR